MKGSAVGGNDQRVHSLPSAALRRCYQDRVIEAMERWPQAGLREALAKVL